MPVSYTHLDVYKRQDMDGLLEELKETADKMSECDNVLIACDLDGGTPYKTALLYRDVYKRQGKY